MLATKTNLLKTRDDLSFALEGYELLEQKREILVLEIMRFVERIKIIESQMNDRFRDSFYVYEETLKKEGKDKLDQLASGCSYDHKVSIRTHKIAGVNLPLVDVEAEKMSLQYSTIHTSSRIDGTMEKFINILSLVAEMAETINSVIRLSKELKKTQRRVNALEKVLIPDHRDNIRMIEERLESDIRDEFFVKKLLKKRK